MATRYPAGTTIFKFKIEILIQPLYLSKCVSACDTFIVPGFDGAPTPPEAALVILIIRRRRGGGGYGPNGILINGFDFDDDDDDDNVPDNIIKRSGCDEFLDR